MRKVNFRLLGFMILSLALVGVVSMFVHGWQVRRNAEVLLREARKAQSRKDLTEAIDYLERYVALVPKNNADPLAELGLLQADAHRAGDAYRTLEAALRQDPSRSDVRRRLVEVALAVRRSPDARHHVEK